MGYTHYWERNPNRTASFEEISYMVFTDLAERIIKTAEEQGIKIADRFGEELGGWLIDDTEVSLNGFDNERYETFAWYKKCPEAKEWWDTGKNTNWFSDFCKTNRNPYDVVVTALLIALKQAYGANIGVRSDGNAEDWEEGLRLFETATRQPASLPFQKAPVELVH